MTLKSLRKNPIKKMNKSFSYFCNKNNTRKNKLKLTLHKKIQWFAIGTFSILSIMFIVFFLKNDIFAEATQLIVEPAGYTNIDSFTFTLTGDPIPGAAKYQYRTGEDAPSTWYDFNPVLSTTVTIPNASHPSGAYLEGENTFYFQALNGSDVVIPGSELSKSYFYNITPPQSPENLQPPRNQYGKFL